METVGERVRSSRERRIMTQGDLANAAGLALVTINRLENDAIEHPRPGTIRKVATALNVDPVWLMFGESESKIAA